ncbi:MAG: rhodanese-like domain-containing protein [Gallionella sp.]|nr:rhodanese-like domain-containing protein [Gallionella sp.]
MKLTTNKILNILIVALLAYVGWQQFNPPAGIAVAEAQTMVQQGAYLLDVREVAEYAEGHAPNAHLIPLGELSGRLQEVVAYKDKPIVVICRSGRRSAKAVQLLKEAGYSQVSNISGGITAWGKAGLPVVTK